MKQWRKRNYKWKHSEDDKYATNKTNRGLNLEENFQILMIMIFFTFFSFISSIDSFYMDLCFKKMFLIYCLLFAPMYFIVIQLSECNVFCIRLEPCYFHINWVFIYRGFCMKSIISAKFASQNKNDDWSASALCIEMGCIQQRKMKEIMKQKN